MLILINSVAHVVIIIELVSLVNTAFTSISTQIFLSGNTRQNELSYASLVLIILDVKLSNISEDYDDDNVWKISI